MLRRIAALAVCLTLVSTMALAQEAQLEDRRDRTEARLDRARDRLGLLGADVDDARTALRAADQRLADAEAQLAAKEAQLADAVAAHEAATARVAAATEELARLTARLERTEARLRAKQGLFEDRVAAAFKYGGGVSYTSVLFESEDIGDLLSSVKYVQTVVERDNEVVDEVTALVERVAAERAEADRVRDQLARDERAAAEAEAEVQRATQQQRQLREQVAADRQQRARALETLKADAAAAAAAVRELEAESQQIERELAELARRQHAAAAAATPRASPGGWVWPASGPMTSSFGYRIHPISGVRNLHEGVDIGAAYGSSVRAADGGVVVYAGWYGGYGLAVIVDHGGSVATLYAHQSSVAVGDGTRVAAGQTVGYVGSTGYSTGPHLHFEVRVAGAPQNPLGWL